MAGSLMSADPDTSNTPGNTEPAGLEIALLTGPLDADQLAGIAGLHARSFIRGWTVQEFAVLLATPGCGAFVAGPPGSPAGLLLFRSARVETEIITLAVDPAWRRRGIGAALTQAFAAWTMTSGAECAHLEVAAENGAAIALYRRLGFVETGRRRGYYREPGSTGRGGGKDAVCMTLTF